MEPVICFSLLLSRSIRLLPAAHLPVACSIQPTGLTCAQIFVMGPIVVLVRRPSLRIPVDPEDVTHDMGAIQAIARISSFASEFSSDVTLKGDPPQWVVQARPLQALPASRRFHKERNSTLEVSHIPLPTFRLWLKGDPPQWVVQVRSLQALPVSRRFY